MAAGVFFVLMAIVVVTRGAKLLGLAAGGSVASEAIAALLGFILLGVTPWLLSLTVFITVLMTLTRAWRDREMDIWFSAGQPLSAWVRPVLVFAIPMALLSASLSLGMTPWAKQKSREYRAQLATRDDMSAVAPGLFKESSRANRVYFVENFSGEGGSARNIFVQEREGERQSVTVAEQGYFMTHADGERILVLQNGRRYEGTVGSPDYRVVEFAEAQVRVEEGDRHAVSTTTEAKTSLSLLGSEAPEEQAELAWRIAIPISAILLALVAVPLAYVNPRVGRTFNLLIAVLLFSIYLNLINVTQSWIAVGRIPGWVGIWPIHLVVGLIAWAMFRWRSRARI